MRRRFGSLLAAGCLLLTLAAPAAATPGGAQPRAITSHPVQYAATDGQRILYHDEQTNELVLFDPAAWSGHTVATGIIRPKGLALGGDWAAYILPGPEKDGNVTLHLLHLTDSQDTVAATFYDITDPTFAQGKLYWAAKRGENNSRDAYRYDLATGKTEQLAAAMQGFRAFVTDGNLFAYENSNMIYAMDLSTGKVSAWGANSATSVSAVSGGKVLFLDAINIGTCGPEMVKLFDPVARTEQYIGQAQCPAGGGQPALSGNLAAFVENAGTGQILLVDTSAKDRFWTYAADGVAKGDVLLAGNYIVYPAKQGGGLYSLGPVGTGDTTPPPPTRWPLPNSVKLDRPDMIGPVPFSDYDPSQPAGEGISLLSHAHLVNGYPDGTFRPDAPLRRAEFLAILMRAYHPAITDGTPFADVPPGHWAYQVVTGARGAGLVAGDGNNQFRPADPMTRAEMAVMLQRFLGLDRPDVPQVFPDLDGVPAWAWARPSVQALGAVGLVEGGPDAPFQPARIVTRGEAAMLLGKLFR